MFVLAVENTFFDGRDLMGQAREGLLEVDKDDDDGITRLEWSKFYLQWKSSGMDMHPVSSSIHVGNCGGSYLTHNCSDAVVVSLPTRSSGPGRRQHGDISGGRESCRPQGGNENRARSRDRGSELGQPRQSVFGA